MRIPILLVIVFLSGCDMLRIPQWEIDQDRRTEIFFKCLKSLPAGPIKTKYNDWDEVVDQCDTVAMYQSRTCVKNCD